MLQFHADEGLPVEEFPQSPQRMAPGNTAVQRGHIQPGVDHSGNPDLARHVGYAVVRNDSRGHRIVKEHKNSGHPIDLAVAFAAASTVQPGAAVVRVRRGGHLALNRSVQAERNERE